MSTRFHLLLGSIALVVGVSAVLLQTWWTAVAMLFLLVSQVAGYRAAKRKTE